MRKSTFHGIHSGLALLILTAVCIAAVPGRAEAQGQKQQVVVFGDSLSDPGNGFAFIKTNATPPDYSTDALLVPSAPYARGGHHLTNGATWIEQVAKPLGATRSVLPAFIGADPYAMNFAVGTGRARPLANNPGLAFQVASFLQKTGGTAPADALYVIQFGGNDVRDALATGNPVLADAILQQAAASIAATVTSLHAAGARRFLVWNVPDVGLTPAAQISELQLPGSAAAASLATLALNGYLALALGPVSALPGIDLIPFYADQLFAAIVNAPWQFDLVNVTDACITPNDPPFRCLGPDQYLFWDGIHPTAAAHGIIARAVGVLLGI